MRPLSVVCLALATALALTACSSGGTSRSDPEAAGSSSPSSASPSPSASSEEPLPSTEAIDKPCSWKIATVGALEGEFAVHGQGIRRGIELAIKLANAEDEVPCHLELESHNSGGDPEEAARAVRRIVKEPRVVACICGYFAGETLEVGGALSDAGILHTSPASTPLTRLMESRTWARAVASDHVQGAAAARYMIEVEEADRILVLGERTEYAIGVASGFFNEAEGRVPLIRPAPGRFDRNDDLVRMAKRKGVDGIFYAGLEEGAIDLVNAMYGFGLRVPFVASDGVLSDTFGAAAFGIPIHVTCPCVEPQELGSARTFTHLHEDEFGEEPAVYAAEMFDMTTFIVAALSESDGDVGMRTARREVVSYFRDGITRRGIVRDYRWRPEGELAQSEDAVWLYEWLPKSFESNRWEPWRLSS